MSSKNSNSALLSRDDIDRFRQDGVVHLRKAFDTDVIASLRRGIAKNMDAPSPRFEARTSDSSPARYCEDFWTWSEFPEFENFVRSSRAARIGAELMGATRVNLVMDNWFLREAGAVARAPWHHDISYFDFDGTMCVLWLPLEATDRNEGIQFVRGSHLWNRLFMRVWFADHQAAAEPQWVNGKYYEPPPDIDADLGQYEIVSFDVDEGDCIVFDIRTLHGSVADSSPRQSHSRYTLRMAAEDARIRYRGDWALAERKIFEAAGHKDGDEINSEFFPTLWSASRAT